MAQWFVATKKADFEGWARQFGIDPVTARVIRNRGIEDISQVELFLHGTKENLHPSELLKDMKEAVELLAEKIRAGKKIRIIGDYDIDGVCAAYLLWKGLTACGANVDVMVPHRVHDGYGLNKNLIDDAFHAGIDTIVTCDNGIAAVEEIAYAAELGLCVVVTDHHEPPLIPPAAAAVIDPKQKDCTYPFKGICGAVVAYKLVETMVKKTGQGELVLPELLEMAAFATVGDVMELKDENRILVRLGLHAMRETKNEGLKALMEVTGVDPKNITPYHIGFVLGPCLNATGRLDTAERALQLLQAKDREEAVEIASKLKDMNDSRKEMTKKGVEEALRQLEEKELSDKHVLVVYLPDAHESLAGIIAGRIREHYHKPVFVLTKAEGCLKGSGRSIEAYSMFSQMQKVDDLFIKYGGHKMAAGLSLPEKKLREFEERINQDTGLCEDDFVEKVKIDVPMPLSYVTQGLLLDLMCLEPFGVGNPKPLFAQKNVSFTGGRILGKNQNVGKYQVMDELGSCYTVIYFGDLDAIHHYITDKFGEEELRKLYENKASQIIMSVAYYPELNVYQGKKSLQFVMQYYS